MTSCNEVSCHVVLLLLLAPYSHTTNKNDKIHCGEFIVHVSSWGAANSIRSLGSNRSGYNRARRIHQRQPKTRKTQVIRDFGIVGQSARRRRRQKQSNRRQNSKRLLSRSKYFHAALIYGPIRNSLRGSLFFAIFELGWNSEWNGMDLSLD